MSGHNVEGDYVESLNDNYSDVASDCSEISEVSNSDFTDFSFLLSQQHFFIRSETLKVFMSLPLARYIVSWNGNGYDLSASSFSWVIFSDDSLVDLNFNTVVQAYGFDPFHEDFSLKTFLMQEIIFLDTSSSPDHSPDFPNEPGYSSDDSVDSMVTESDEISCEYFNGQSVYFSFYIKKASLIPYDPIDQ
ncbi:hypothetical protein F8M41_018539, partial [Gigaspora margarita]